MKKRIYKFDNLKGALIYLVVLGHLLVSYNNDTSIVTKLVLSFIYSFHMPLFFIISGYFSKKDINRKSIIKLIIIFIIMNLSFSIYDYFTTTTLSVFTVKYSSWYILLLLIYRLLTKTNLIKRFIKETPIPFLILLFLISIVVPIIKIDIFILRIFENYFYFLLGYILIDSEHKHIKIDKISPYLILILLLLINFFLSTIYINDISFFMGRSYIYKEEPLVRLILIITNTCISLVTIPLISNKEIPIITNVGKYSLYIYMLHRIPTLIISQVLIPNSNLIIFFDIIIALILCLILSLKKVVEAVNKVINLIQNTMVKSILTAFIILLLLYTYQLGFQENKINNVKKDTITISYIGDLILLEEQVKLSKNILKYNFDYMFEYTRKYINDADYTIGVFEGPSDDSKMYSIGNYNDNKRLKLNYPTTFIDSIKNAGIDLVTIANNHIFDVGRGTVTTTIKNLKRKQLDYIGGGVDNPQRKVVNIKGKKIGLLAYTYGTNCENDKKEQLVKYLEDPQSTNFDKKKQAIKKDFDYLKKQNVDLIIVLPHYGTEFNFDFDNYQEEWNKVFAEYGANLILGDHSHVIGPIKYYSDTVAISSPGNYVNSYNGKDSDISNFITITIDKENKISKIEVIPLLAIKEDKGYYPISLYDLSKKERDNKRIKQALYIFGKVVLNDENITLQEKYEISITNKEKEKLELNEDDKETYIYQLINNSNKICFIGDSITEGTKNNYHGWYEPLMKNFDKEVINISKGSYTTNDAIKNFKTRIKESNCDLSVINIGTNDIRYNRLNSKDYIKNIKKIISYIKRDTNILLISPWETYKNDKVIGNYILEKKDLYGKYNEELINLSDSNNNISYINPNRYIKKYIMYYGEQKYLLDGIHPNEHNGINLYSYAVLRGDKY